MTDLSEMPSPLSQPLVDSDLHVWSASLTGSREELSHYSSLLSADEKTRAEKFYFERDQRRYIFGRGILRTLIANYLKINASKIAFIYGAYGKPALEKAYQNKILQFNLAHSNDWALYIFGWDRPLGIDLEHIRPLQDADDFAKQFFSQEESSWISSVSIDQKWNAFYKLWTCKEAFLKANGSGLTVPLNEAEIFIKDDNSAKLTSFGRNLEEAAKWRLEIFNPTDNYQAAIAVEGNQGQVIFRYYDIPSKT